MAKKKTSVNKSALIREFIGKGLSPKEVMAAMKKKGHTVSAAYVSTVKSNSKTPAKSKAPAKSKTATKSKVAKSHTLAVSDLMKAKTFVAGVGGIKKAKELVEMLEKLS